MSTHRQSDHPIHPQFLERWSPRAFSETGVTEAEVLTVLEAARWAPSASNLQPWRFVYALKGTPEFDAFVATLVPFNQAWARNAGALIIAASVKTFDGERPAAWHSFDTGAATAYLALQAHHLGLAAHGMGGFDADAAAEVLGLPDTLKVEAVIALGRPGTADSLPEGYREREVPSTRQPLSEMVFKGRYPQPEKQAA